MGQSGWDKRLSVMLKEKAGLLLPGIVLAYDTLSDEPAPSARQAPGTGSKARILNSSCLGAFGYGQGY
jgi:hypothetical protein